MRPSKRRGRARSAPRPAPWLLLGAVVAVGIGAGCSGSPGRTIGAYCDEVNANLAALTNPTIASGPDIESTIDRYRSIAEVAPAGVEPEWQRVITALETAATVIAGDQASSEIANQAALAGAPAYATLQRYTQDSCNISIGTPPTPTNPVTATTVVPLVPPSTLGG